MSYKQNRGSVLIADDHPIVLSGLEGLLSAAGCFDVVAAYANGGEAWMVCGSSSRSSRCLISVCLSSRE